MPFYDYEGNILNVSSAFVDVVNDFGAKADGTTDDSTAIQNALDSLKNTGGIIFFPKGTYSIKSSLIFYSHQTLWFENGAILLDTTTSLNNIMRSYCDSITTEYNGTHDVVIYGGIFDGSGHYHNNTLIGMVHAKNITIENCTFRNSVAGYHNIEINSSCNVKVINCDHEGAQRNTSNAELIQIDVVGSTTYPWDDVNDDGTSCKYVEISGCYFHNDTVSPAVGCHNGSSSFINIHDNVFDGFTSERGAINFSSGVGNVDIHDNTFNGCTIGVGSSGATYYIHDNRFVDATTAISGSSSVANANMINGTYTA